MMSMRERAAQFSPFAALVGYDEKVKEKGRHVEKKIELDESAKDILDRKLYYMEANIDLEYVITYFKADDKKDGGAYMTTISAIKRIDKANKRLILSDDLIIAVDDIIDIDSTDVDLTAI